jgi:hypothetical protein
MSNDQSRALRSTPVGVGVWTTTTCWTTSIRAICASDKPTEQLTMSAPRPTNSSDVVLALRHASE